MIQKRTQISIELLIKNSQLTKIHFPTQGKYKKSNVFKIFKSIPTRILRISNNQIETKS